MVEVTEVAENKVLEYFDGKETQPVRIFLNEGGCGGPGLGMALDQKKENDAVHEVGDLTFIVDKTFLEEAKPIKVDFGEVGFKLTSSMEFPEPTCGSCGSAGTCG